MPKIVPGSMATQFRYGRLYMFLVRAFWRVRTPSGPCRFGSVAVGDDPFSGRRQGVVAVKNGRTVGLQTPDRIYFYDYRQVTWPD